MSSRPWSGSSAPVCCDRFEGNNHGLLYMYASRCISTNLRKGSRGPYSSEGACSKGSERSEQQSAHLLPTYLPVRRKDQATFERLASGINFCGILRPT